MTEGPYWWPSPASAFSIPALYIEQLVNKSVPTAIDRHNARHENLNDNLFNIVDIINGYYLCLSERHKKSVATFAAT